MKYNVEYHKMFDLYLLDINSLSDVIIKIRFNGRNIIILYNKILDHLQYHCCSYNVAFNLISELIMMPLGITYFRLRYYRLICNQFPHEFGIL